MNDPHVSIVMALGTALITRVADKSPYMPLVEYYYWEDYAKAPGQRFGPFVEINNCLAHYNSFGELQKNVVNVDFKKKRRLPKV